MGEKVTLNRKKFQTTKYLLAFIISTLIFIIGVGVGNYISTAKLNKIDGIEQDIKSDVFGIELQYLLLTENPCSAVEENLGDYAEELYELGEKLTFMESKLDKNDPDVLRLKEYYSLLLIRHWLFLKKANEECDYGRTLILYFYSNVEGECPKCEEQGFVLTTIRKKNEDVRTYSFDINIDNVALNTVKTMFGITAAPTLVINDKIFVGFKDKKEVEEILRKP